MRSTSITCQKGQVTCDGSVRSPLQTRLTRFFLLLPPNPLFLSKMSSKYYSCCLQIRVLSSFLLDPSNPASKELKTCASCRVSIAKSDSRPFGGVNVLLCGDFYQLLPVAGKPLYSLSHPNVNAIKGY
jgi:hypothetical protein